MEMAIYNFSTRLHTVLNFFTICLELAEIIRIFYFNCLCCLSRVLVANTNNNTHKNSSNGLFNIKYTSIISCLLLICLCNFYYMLNYEHTKLKFDEKKNSISYHINSCVCILYIKTRENPAVQ